MSVALRVQHVTRAFGAVQAVDGVTLEVEHHERRAIIGPNGAGKTTLFNVIMGHLPPTSGQVWLGEHDVTRLHVHARIQRGLARTFQRNNLFLGLSVHDNIWLAQQRRLGVAGHVLRPARSFTSVADALEDVLARCGLRQRAGVTAAELSYGEQRQLEVALALACQPSVLLLDEPTAGMSPAETARMTELISGLPRTITILIIEHDMDVVFALADRITVMHHGQVLAEGSTDEVRGLASVQEAYLGTTSSRLRLSS